MTALPRSSKVAAAPEMEMILGLLLLKITGSPELLFETRVIISPFTSALVDGELKLIVWGALETTRT